MLLQCEWLYLNCQRYLYLNFHSEADQIIHKYTNNILFKSHDSSLKYLYIQYNWPDSLTVLDHGANETLHEETILIQISVYSAQLLSELLEKDHKKNLLLFLLLRNSMCTVWLAVWGCPWEQFSRTSSLIFHSCSMSSFQK